MMSLAEAFLKLLSDAFNASAPAGRFCCLAVQFNKYLKLRILVHRVRRAGLIYIRYIFQHIDTAGTLIKYI